MQDTGTFHDPKNIKLEVNIPCLTPFHRHHA